MALELLEGPRCLRTPANLDSSSLSQHSQEGHHRAEVLNKPPIEVCEANETLNLLNCGGNRPVEDSFNLLMIHLHVARSDEEAEKLSLGYMKLTFLQLYVEMIVKESLEDPADMPLMLLQ